VKTDFVAKSNEFVNFTNFALDLVVEKQPADIAALLELTKDGKKFQMN